MLYNRRDFLRRSAAGAAGGLVRDPLSLLARSAREEFREIRRNVGIYTNRGGTVGWLNNLGGAVVVDSQYADTAEDLLNVLRDIGARPVHALFNTHHHADHTGGNKPLRYVTRFLVAHERSAANQREFARLQGTDAEQSYPDTTFSDSWDITVRDERIRATYYGPAHTGGDSVVFFENANIAHVGDLVNHGAYPNIDGPFGGSVSGWVSALEKIAAQHDGETIYIFGHADPASAVTGSRAELLRQRDYLTAVQEAARRAIREGRSRSEAVALQSLPGFQLGGTVDRLGLALGIAYDELQAGQG